MTDAIPDPERGPAARQRPEDLLAALALPTQGRTFSLALPRFTGMPLFGAHPPFDVTMYRTPAGLRGDGIQPWGPVNEVNLGYMAETVSGTAHSGAHVGVHEHRHDRGRRDRTVDLHGSSLLARTQPSIERLPRPRAFQPSRQTHMVLHYARHRHRSTDTESAFGIRSATVQAGAPPCWPTTELPLGAQLEACRQPTQPRRRAGRNGGERNKVLAMKPASSDG